MTTKKQNGVLVKLSPTLTSWATKQAEEMDMSLEEFCEAMVANAKSSAVEKQDIEDIPELMRLKFYCDNNLQDPVCKQLSFILNSFKAGKPISRHKNYTLVGTE